MRSTKQTGGNDMPTIKYDMPQLPEVAQIPKAHFIDNTMTPIPRLTVSGGKARKKFPAGKAKPAASAKVKAAAKGKPAAKKKGGSLAEDIKSLAVPFAILLAKEGLDTMFNGKNKSAKASMSASKPASGRKKTAVGGQKGGACGSCSTNLPTVGGGAREKSRYASLANDIDMFLRKY